MEIHNEESLLNLALCCETSQPARPFPLSEWFAFQKLCLRCGVSAGTVLGCSESELSSLLGLSAESAARTYILLRRLPEIVRDMRAKAASGVSFLPYTDERFPLQLKERMGEQCPPVLYAVGNTELLRLPAAGYVGVREVESDDLRFVQNTVAKTCAQGYAVVSGGARGVDTTAAHAAVANGSAAVQFLCESPFSGKLQRRDGMEVSKGTILHLTHFYPTHSFSSDYAFFRNKLIYEYSQGTVIAHAHYGTGGTWSGAVRNIRDRGCKLYCRADAGYAGNAALIGMGAIPITADWDGAMLQPRWSD